MQDMDSLEILVDGSTDGTAGQVAALADLCILLNVFPENRGACVALNDAIRRSRGRFNWALVIRQ